MDSNLSAALTVMFTMRCAVAGILFAGAVYMIVKMPSQDGWGWLLFIGLLVTPSFPDITVKPDKTQTVKD